jgi:hypothetical protein
MGYLSIKMAPLAQGMTDVQCIPGTTGLIKYNWFEISGVGSRLDSNHKMVNLDQVEFLGIPDQGATWIGVGL